MSCLYAKDTSQLVKCANERRMGEKTCIPLDDVTGLSVASESCIFYTEATERSPMLGDDHVNVGVFFSVCSYVHFSAPVS